MKTKAILVMLTACALLATASCSTPGSEIENTHENTGVALAAVEKTDAEINTLFAARIHGPALPSHEKPAEEICTDYTDTGLLRISYTSETDARLKLQVLKDGNTIAYNLKGDGSIEDFSLQYGNGEYTARIMQNVKDDEYVVVTSKTFDVTLKNEQDVYLNSIQNVNWNYDKKPIQDIRFMVSTSLTGLEDAKLLSGCSEELYQYVTENIQYDSAKVFNLMYDYLPDIEKTYIEGSGICYDYASLYAAMLRSIGIPAKLVKGYTLQNPDVYHAWNEVYIGGEWVVIDTTLDASIPQGTVPMEKNSQDYAKVYEY